MIDDATQVRRRAIPQAMLGPWAIEPTRFAAIAQQVGLSAVAAPAAKQQQPENYEITGDGVAIIQLRGVFLKNPDWIDLFFGGDCCSTTDAAEWVQDAATRPDVKSILLVIESPGGQAAATPELAAAVANAASAKRVVAFIEDIGASAAYWVASQATEIYINPTGMAGSIGTYCVLTDLTGMLDNVGIKFTVVSSGGLKGIGADGSVPEELVADTQRLISGLNAYFLAGVMTGRDMDKASVQKLADGRVWIGAEAVSNGLVDKVGTISDAMASLINSQTKGSPMLNRAPRISAPIKSLPPEEQAKADWAANKGGVQEKFIDEATYVATIKFEAQNLEPMPDAGPVIASMEECLAAWKAEWRVNTGGCRAVFIDEPTFIAYRRQEQQTSDRRLRIQRP